MTSLEREALIETKAKETFDNMQRMFETLDDLKDLVMGKDEEAPVYTFSAQVIMITRMQLDGILTVISNAAQNKDPEMLLKLIRDIIEHQENHNKEDEFLLHPPTTSTVQ